MGRGLLQGAFRRNLLLTGIAWLYVAFCCAGAHAACHAVTPTGAGTKNGSSWTNAMAGLPANLTAGDIYYVADGAYPSYLMGSSGTISNVITVRKANATDQGQNCSPSIGAGWNAATMGSSQATFTAPFFIQGSFFTLDGQTRNPDWTGGGIKITMPNTACGNNGKGIFVDDFGPATSNVTIQYVEIAGPGYSVSPDTCEQTGVYAVPNAPNFTFQYSYIHDVTSGPFQMVTDNTVLIQYNLVARNQSTPLSHAEAIADSGSLNVTVRYNKWVDIVGTGVIVELNPAVTSNSSNWAIYGNLFYWTPGNPNGRTDGFGNGLVSCQDTRTCTGWVIYNNTIAGCNWTNFFNCGIDFAESASGSSVLVQNNLWYNSNSVTMTTAAGITNSHDYNTFVSSTGSPAEPHGATGAANPFVNFGAFDLHLIQDMSSASTAGTQWAQGLALPSPFTTDLDGVTRGLSGTWDRGAFEFAGAGGAPAAPTNLTVVVH